MSQKIHIIPTGFDRHRLITPFVKGDLKADKVILVYTQEDERNTERHEEEVGLVNDTVTKLKNDFKNYADVPEVETKSYADISNVEGDTSERDDIYHYDRVYRSAYDFLKKRVSEGHTVYVNVSSMPRTVVFGFSTAATTLVSDEPDRQDQLHTYYVAPNKYFGPRMKNQISNTSDFLNHLQYEVNNILNKQKEADTDITERLEEVQDEIKQHQKSVEGIYSEIERYGLTKGAMDIDGSHYIEFPQFRHPDVAGGEIAVLYTINNVGEANSISELAGNLSEVLEKGDKESLKSTVQYNVRKLVDKGFVERKENGGKGYNYRLSKMGELWSEKHDMETELQEYKERSKD